MNARAPDPQPKPKFARWLFDRGLKTRDAGEVLDCSGESVRRYCLPFAHPDRRIPSEDTLAKIVEWTAGEVTAADFYPPALNGAAAAAARVPDDVQ